MKRFSLYRRAAHLVALLASIATTSAYAGAPDLEVVEYYHPETRHYFMTGSKSDQVALDALPAQFKRTGRSFAAWSQTVARPVDAVAVIRFFNPSVATHVFTASATDIALLRALPTSRVANGFVDEGVAFYLLKSSDNTCATGQKAIFRAYNNRPDGNHRYSNDLPTQAATVKTGFVHEGVAFCAPNATSNDAIEKSAGTPREAGEDIKVSGSVSSFVSVTDFMVGTQKVNAGGARFDSAAASALANGVSVRVEGVVIGGVLMATEVKFLNAPNGVVDEFKGFVTALGTAGKLFVNGTEIDVSTALVTGGVLANIVVGTEVELHGNFVDGVFVATRLHIEDAPGVVDMSGNGLAEVQGAIANFVGVANFTVNGQKVDATNATFRDGTAANLANGVTVEAKGKITNGALIATRVEIKASGTTTPGTNPPDMAEFEAKGTVSDFVSVAQFTLGGKSIDASGAIFLRGTTADLKNGAIVEVKGTLVDGKVIASRVKFDDDLATTPPGTTPPVSTEFEAKGAISSFASVASFVLAGKTVDASTASFIGGTAADLKNGAIVEVKGTIVNGVVKATRVSFEDAPDAIEFEAKGAISSFVSVSSFVVGGQTIDASAASFERGTAPDLRNGVIVEVKGDLVGGIVKAERVRFER
jgi:hypothetical protein